MKLKILWAISFDYESRSHSGAYLRYFNFAPELIRQGHEIRFLVHFLGTQPEDGRAFFRSMRRDGVITDFEEWPAPKVLPVPFVTRLTMHPRLEQRWFRQVAAAGIDVVNAAIARGDANCLILAPQTVFPLYGMIPAHIPVAIDFCDVISLAMRRELRNLIRQGAWRRIPRQLREIQYFVTKERYYGRRVALNLVVSQVDKQAMDRVTGEPARTVAILNGVHFGKSPEVVKIPDQLIFSGVMDFPPNEAAAVWFCTHVMPRTLAKRPNTQLILAGARPSAKVLALAGDHVVVTGFVPDLAQEIARSALFVNPIVSGTGFRNKVVEAVAAGTFVVSTPLGIEFLPPSVRQYISAQREPEAMSQQICELLAQPTEVQRRLLDLRQRVEAEFMWSSKANELASALVPLVERASVAR